MTDGMAVSDTRRAILDGWSEPAAIVAVNSAPDRPHLLEWNEPFSRWFGEVPESGFLPVTQLSRVRHEHRALAFELFDPTHSETRTRIDLFLPEADAEARFDEALAACTFEIRRVPLGDGASLLLFHDVDREERALRRVRDLEDADAVGVFAHGVAHSVRNQLTVLLGSAFTLKRTVEKSDPDLAASLVDTLDRVSDGVRGATQQIQAFADYGSPVSDGSPAVFPNLLDESLRPLVDNAFIKGRIELEWGTVGGPVVVAAPRVDVGALLLQALRAYLVTLPEESILRIELVHEGRDFRVEFRPSLPDQRSDELTGLDPEGVRAWRPVRSLAERLAAHVEFLAEGNGLGLDLRFTVQP